MSNKPFQQPEEKPKVDFNASKDASQAELLRIMKQQAGSDEDRWKILDARDNNGLTAFQSAWANGYLYYRKNA